MQSILKLKNNVVHFLSHLKAWFFNLEIGHITLFSPSYKTELIVVCSTIEELSRMARRDTEKKGIKLMKRIIKNRTKHIGLDKKFDRFLDKNVRRKV